MNKDCDLSFGAIIRIEILNPKPNIHYSKIKLDNVPVKNLINFKIEDRITATIKLSYKDFKNTFNDLQPLEGIDYTLIDGNSVEHLCKFKLILIHQHEEY